MKHTVPYGLQLLEACKETAPTYFQFDLDELKEVMEGQNWDKHQEALFGLEYIDDFPKLLAWWSEHVASALTFGRASDYDPHPDNATVVTFRNRCRDLLADVYATCPPALVRIPDFANVERPQEEIAESKALEMFKAYGRFRQYVSDFAERIWPDQNLQWLTMHP